MWGASRPNTQSYFHVSQASFGPTPPSCALSGGTCRTGVLLVSLCFSHVCSLKKPSSVCVFVCPSQHFIYLCPDGGCEATPLQPGKCHLSCSPCCQFSLLSGTLEIDFVGFFCFLVGCRKLFQGALNAKTHSPCSARVCTSTGELLYMESRIALLHLEPFCSSQERSWRGWGWQA